MTSELPDPGSAIPASSRLPWPDPVLNRRAELRDDPTAVREFCASARVVLVARDGSFLVRMPHQSDHAGISQGWSAQDGFGGSEPPELVDWSQIDPGAETSSQALLIGQIPDVAGRGQAQNWCAIGASAELRQAPPPPGTEWTTLRIGNLPAAQREVAEAAVALTQWHALEPQCDRCHGQTTPSHGGWTRCCDQGHESFPRTDPAVIMALVDAHDRLLLAHQATWGPGRCSVLAGFVEAGESAEAAVAREVAEEVGLNVQQVRYLHSQPWPFPRSLMLGFTVRAEGDPRPDGVEIEWARWLTPDELDSQTAAGALVLPGPASIAGKMIELWRRGLMSG